MKYRAAACPGQTLDPCHIMLVLHYSFNLEIKLEGQKDGSAIKNTSFLLSPLRVSPLSPPIIPLLLSFILMHTQSHSSNSKLLIFLLQKFNILIMTNSFVLLSDRKIYNILCLMHNFSYYKQHLHTH